VWTWIAMDADTKLGISYLVGKRDADHAFRLMQDLAARIASRFQLTTRNWRKRNRRPR
jgi:IS1 family transposase